MKQADKLCFFFTPADAMWQPWGPWSSCQADGTSSRGRICAGAKFGGKTTCSSESESEVGAEMTLGCVEAGVAATAASSSASKSKTKEKD